MWRSDECRERWDWGAGDPFTRILAPNQSQVFQADTTGQLVHIGMQAQRADTEAGPFVRVSFVLTGTSMALYLLCAITLLLCLSRVSHADSMSSNARHCRLQLL